MRAKQVLCLTNSRILGLLLIQCLLFFQLIVGLCVWLLFCYSVLLCSPSFAIILMIPGVASSIQARSYTFVEIDHEIISTVIFLPSADSFKKGCCQLQAKVCARITG